MSGVGLGGGGGRDGDGDGRWAGDLQLWPTIDNRPGAL
jgi:hypothetical protein